MEQTVVTNGINAIVYSEHLIVALYELSDLKYINKVIISGDIITIKRSVLSKQCN